jgi:uncharacterized protein
MTDLLTGLALGLSGSAHCAVMCGPLVLALHRHADKNLEPPARGTIRRAASRGLTTRLAAHHAGRLALYAVAGLVAGGVGHAAGSAGLGRVLAASTGAALVVGACRRQPLSSSGRSGRAIGRRLGRLASIATRVIGRWPHAHSAALGALNGLLPCGMVYAALTASLALGSAWRAGLFMLGFGAGTLPVLAAALAAAPKLSSRLPRLALAARVVTVVIGLFLIAQGVGLSAGRRAAEGAQSGDHHHHHLSH